MLLLLLQLVVGLPCAFAPPRFNAESFADHSQLNSTDDHQHAHNGTDGLQHLLNKTESLHHHNESLVLHHNETERTHPQNGTESPVRQRGNGTDANPGHRQPEISSVRRHLADDDGDDDNEDDEVPETVHINKELFERKHMERSVRPHKNASAPILAATRNRTRGRPERPHARMADRTDGRDAAQQADCLQRAACVYGAARRRDELHAGNTAVNSKESLDEVGRFLVEYADKAVEAHGQQAKDALFTGYHSGKLEICQRMYLCDTEFTF